MTADPRIAELFRCWEDACRRGEQIDPETLCTECPELLDDLRRQIGSAESKLRFFATTAREEGVEPVVEQAPMPVRIGRYRVDVILGRGGFGVVYLAIDEQLERRVAVKVPHARLLTNDRIVATYRDEARIAAGLDHENIVPVYDVGGDPQIPCYIVSKYIGSSDLRGRLAAEARWSFPHAAALIATVAEAVHYAHTRGVVHRDLKPGNILLDATSKPYVADFGLALTDQEFGHGPMYVGTPAYMSPEQARCEGHRVDGRTDIFSLGIVLYETLTGRRPFSATSKEELLRLIASTDARPLRQIDDSIPRELDRICLKALARRATDRYMTARDLADDLRHFLQVCDTPSPAVSPGPVRFPGASSQSPLTAVDSPFPLLPGSMQSDKDRAKIVPKGLRVFDEHDADFFLSLLPGPRDREGLPETIRFWKTHIEESIADSTFPVGVIYGPSGCGKSSLVRAGLLPRLNPTVVPLYVEATGTETELRLRQGLRRVASGLDEGLPLPLLLAAVRQGQGPSAGQKLLIVLDQFEQWLHARSEYAGTELLQALRQCDGGRVQCLVLIRDDFWMPATRFLRDLELGARENINSLPIDLFDPAHARKVLIEFGRAFGRLPDNPRDLTSDQERFLRAAVDGLALDGRIIPVRLSLFAEMIKGKEWTAATLRSVGGAEGLGLRFLEETFSSPHAPLEHRLHQKAIRAVLSALIPLEGKDLKGAMRSRAELMADSGYVGRDAELDAVLRILNDLKLITPTDPEGMQPDDNSRESQNRAGRYYQLAHDYLVPVIREWLNRKRRESVRGRAYLLLESRAREWGQMQQSRFLPSLVESIKIALFTRSRDRDATQRSMIRAAWASHLRRIAVALAVVLCAALIVSTLLPNRSNPYAALNRFRDRSAQVQERRAALAKLDLADDVVRRSVLETLNSEQEVVVASDALQRLAEFAAREPRARDQVLDLIHAKVQLPDVSNDYRLVAFERLRHMAAPQEVLAILRKVRVARDAPQSDVWNARVAQFVAEIQLDRLEEDDRRQTLRVMLAILDGADEGSLAEHCAARLDVESPKQLLAWLVDVSRKGGAILLRANETLLPYVIYRSRDGSDRLRALAGEIQRQFLELYRAAEETSDLDSFVAQYLLESLGLIAGRLRAAESARGSFDESRQAVARLIAEIAASDGHNAILAPALSALPPLFDLSLKKDAAVLDSVRLILSAESNQPWEMKALAAKAAGDLRDTRSVRELKPIAGDRSEHRDLRKAALGALVGIAQHLRGDGRGDRIDPVVREISDYLVSFLEDASPDDAMLVNEFLPSVGKLADPGQAAAIFRWLLQPPTSPAAVGAAHELILSAVQSEDSQAAQSASVAIVVNLYLEWRSSSDARTLAQGGMHPDQMILGLKNMRGRTEVILRADRLVRDALEAAKHHPDARIRAQAERLADAGN